MSEFFDFYSGQMALAEASRKKVTRTIYVLTFGRLFFFVAFIAFPIFLYGENRLVASCLSLFSLAIFLFLVKLFVKASGRRKYFENMIEINRLELLAIDHQFSVFQNGEAFINPDHFNSYDLDLFGNGSLFQYLNRTITLGGREKLANSLQQPILTIEILQKRQLFLKELSGKVHWRQQFMATGKLNTESETDSRIFENWSTEKVRLNALSFTNLMLIVLPVCSVGALLFWILAGNSALFIFTGLLQFALWFYHKKSINSLYRRFGKKANMLTNYASLFNLIEKENWTSEEAIGMFAELRQNGLPSEEFNKLRRIISAFDNRNNMFVGVVINLLFSWDVWCTKQLVNWHVHNISNFHRWNETLSLFDASNSLANYSYNHPTFAYPRFISDNFNLTAEQMGHPLIPSHKRVDNHFEIVGSQQLVIVTGANMAGKSTFLRTVGINMVLGMTGAPVCAKSMQFKPVEVFSNMRTTDSLFNDESYFFAELKRLKMILDEMEKGRELLIILDEILKGTNSVDKLAGSQKLVQRLVGHKAPAIIATHDLKLTEMATDYPLQVKNQCFEIEIENDEMHFDYQLRPGVTTIMNATFLMKKMGIID